MLIFFFISGTFATTVSSVSALALVEDSWNTKTPMSQARTGVSAIVVDGKIYAIGGETAGGEVGGNERYNPKTNTWTTLKSMPKLNAIDAPYFAKAVYQNKIYCIHRVTEVYDTVTNSWETKAAIPDNPYDMLGTLYACAVNGQIYVMGARNLRLFMYDPVTDEWTQKARVPENIAVGGAPLFFLTEVDDDKIVVVGAFSRTVEGPRENKVLVYDVKTDAWGKVNSAPHLLDFTTCAGVTSGRYVPQKLYFFRETTTDVYDPVTNMWSTTKSMPTPRKDVSVAVVNDIFYIIGGYTTEPNPDSHPMYPTELSRASSVNEQYVPIGYSSTPLASKPATTVAPTSSNLIVSPKPSSENTEFFITGSIVAIIAITTVVATVATFVFFYTKRRKKL